MAYSKQYLEWHGQQWRVVVKVPTRLRGLIGRTKLKHPLHTADLKEADARKGSIVTRFKTILAEADRAMKNGNPLEAEALQLRLHADDEGMQDWLHDRAEQIEAAEGYPSAKAFYDLASGQVTPVDHHADAFKRHKAYSLKTAGDYDRVLRWLKDWLRDQKLPVALEAITRQIAGRFIDGRLTVDRSKKKVIAYLSLLREYWKWLRQRGHADENPWLDHDLPATPRPHRDAEPDAGPRPCTDDEAAKLLFGPVESFLRRPGRDYMRDLMHIAALSGLRIEEICELRVSDCEGGMFAIPQGKTAAARRTVPIHSKLAGIIKRRTKNRKPGDYLIAGLPSLPGSRESRSDPASKAFTRYRRGCGVDERPNGKRRSNVDFHSFRRWFIRKVRTALHEGAGGFDERTLIWVVGHVDSPRDKTLDLSQIGYAGPDPEKAKRALVESVKLPSRPPATQRGKPDA